MNHPTAPQSVDAFFQRLNEKTPGMPKRMRESATYIAANSERIALSTVAEIATGAGVQPSAIMRFCQAMGFSGFSQMQRLFRNSLSAQLPDYGMRLTNLREQGADTPSGLLAEFIEAGRLSLENLAKTIDLGSLGQAVTTLSRAEMIHVVGLRRAFPVATYLVYAFEKMQIPAMLHDGTGKLDHRHALRANDAVIAITFAPYSDETIRLASAATEQGLPVVGITDTHLSPLNLPGITLLSVSEVDFGAFRSLSATLSLAISLAVAVGAAKDKAGRDEIVLDRSEME